MCGRTSSIVISCGRKEKMYEIPDLSQYKTDYVGDSSNVINIVRNAWYGKLYSCVLLKMNLPYISLKDFLRNQ